MPPLRERGNDIMMLADHFLKIANHELDRDVTTFSPEVIECFMHYRWQGNIRELKNVVRRATLLSEGNEITMKTLPLEISNFNVSAFEPIHSSVTNEPKEPRHDLKNAALGAEHETILKVLREVNFNKTKAAEILNIDRKTLYNKMKAINLK
jgi:two-component system response regulator HydG